jgi:transcription initiation factor TFIIE subunit alpha
VNRDYYYIPLHPVIDAIKYRVSRLTSIVRAQYTPSEDRAEYVCRRCGAEWTELDVLSLVSEEGFECQQCGNILERTEDVRGEEGVDRTGHEKNSRLMAQLDNMLKLLRQIDATEIPPNDFDTAWDHKIDIKRNQQTHPSRPAIAAPSRQQAVRGNMKTDASAIEVSLTSSAEKSKAEQAAEAARKAALEKQNALPVWHTHSTVSTAHGTIHTSNIKLESNTDIKPEIKEEEEQKTELDATADIAAYYAEIARAKAEDVSSPEEDTDGDYEEGDEDGEDEFEDVGVLSNADTPVLSFNSVTSVPSRANNINNLGSSSGGKGTAMMSGGIKREFESESGSSAAPTVVGTPATPVGNGGPTKKIKTEDGANAVIKEEDREVSDEDDEEEFEDV